MSGSSLAVLFYNKNRSTQQDLEIFGTICSADQIEILPEGIVQAETATLRCLTKSCKQQALLIFSANSTPPTGKQLFYRAMLCNGKTFTACQLDLSAPGMA